MSKFNSVTKAEFEAWVAAYPRELVRNVHTVCEPPMVSFNDFQRAPYWPDSMVASYVAAWDDSDPAHGYRVVENIDSPLLDDGTRETDEDLFDKNGQPVAEGDRVRVWWASVAQASGTWTEEWREDTVLIRDKGTKYQRWSLESCHNFLRSLPFELVTQ